MKISDFRITDHDKLDIVLVKLCEMIVDNLKTDDSGLVAAAIIDPDNNTVLAVNRPSDDGKRTHAERAVMEDYIEKYGKIPKGSILVTTLSPCSTDYLEGREGVSCTDLINQSPIRKVYSGYQDPSQDHSEAWQSKRFHEQTTRNRKIRKLCQKFADQFVGKLEQE